MSPRLAKRSVALGFIAAVLATILGSPLTPEHPTSALSVLTRALAYVTAVFGIAAIATQLMFMADGKERESSSEELAIRTATAALWLPPLLMFYGQRSWFALAIFVVLVIEVARVVASLKGVSYSSNLALPETSPDGLTFAVLKRDFPFGSSILAVFML